MKAISMDDIEGKTNKRGVESKQLLKNDHAQIMNLNLKPGDEVPTHSVPVNVFFYVVSGTGTIRIGEDGAVVEEKDIVPCPPETEMSLSADQGKKFSVLNVKTPSL
ncbi:cupin domain-containing protein [Candidatus Bipolaricaulota bacterium]|nr:cupin domain-containing protein [Candidatus Bipolaricaulota bacterium]